VIQRRGNSADGATATSSDEENPVSHFLSSLNDLFEHALQGVSDSDMVGITIQNEVNQYDKAIGISFRRKDQLSGCDVERV